jgi:hypothetical protein
MISIPRRSELGWLACLALGASGLGLSGCGSEAPRVIAMPAPAVDREAALVAAVRAAREARRSEIRGLKADVTVGLSSPEWPGAGTAEGTLVARRPGDLRLRGYAAFVTVFDAVTDGRQFWLHVPPLRRVYAGEADQVTLPAGLPILPGEIVAALFAEPYGAADQPLRVLPGREDSWLAWDVSEGHEVHARYRHAPTLLERAELWRGDRMIARLDYLDYRRRDGVWWPARMEFDWPEERSRMSLDFGEVTFNPPIEDVAFQFVPPAGATIVRLEEESP